MDSKKLYISDLHIGHGNILRLDDRPFELMEDMHQTIIEKWNSVVNPQDHVYLIGDILWRANDENLEVLKSLKGNRHLIVGNHDKWAEDKRITKHFASVSQYKEIKDGLYKVTLSHFPFPWFRTHRSSHAIHLYGHVHMTEEFKEVLRAQRSLIRNPEIRSHGNAFNVGAMVPYMDYTPRTLEEILVSGRQFNEEFYNNEDLFIPSMRSEDYGK